MCPNENLKQHSVTLKKREPLSAQYLILTFSRPEAFHFEAGQYATFQFQDAEGSFSRSYSIASPPSSKKILEFCIQLQNDGRGGQLLSELKIGDTCMLSSPQGTFRIVDPQKELVFIAGGSGISPLRAFIKEILSVKKGSSQIQLIYGCKDAASIPFKEELLTLSQKSAPHSFKAFLFSEKKTSFPLYTGTVATALLEIPNLIHSNAHFYLCGPPKMIDEIQSLLISKSVSAAHIFREKYS